MGERMRQHVTIRLPWVRSLGWDACWMLSGFWLILLVAALEAIPDGLHLILITATVLLWFAHRIATTYTAFCLSAYRQILREQGERFFVWPAVATLLVCGFVFAPEQPGALDFRTKLLVLGTVFFFGQHVHGGMQHYGVVSIYRMRAGQSHSAPFKRYEQAFCLMVGALMVAIGQIYHGAAVVRGSFISPMLRRILPLDVFAGWGVLVQLIGPLLVVILTIPLLIAECRDQRPSMPKALYAGSVSLQAILAYVMSPLGFLILWSVQHWMVSVALAGHMAGQHTGGPRALSGWYTFWARFNQGFWPTLLVLCLASVLATPFLQYPFDRAYLLGWRSALSPLPQHSGVVRFVVAVSYSSLVVHFLMDRAVFRFSDSRIRQVTSALIFGDARSLQRRMEEAVADRHESALRLDTAVENELNRLRREPVLNPMPPR